nr:hypothetical protein Iba_chr06aCG14020 [Ipomoea batatas]
MEPSNSRTPASTTAEQSCDVQSWRSSLADTSPPPPSSDWPMVVASDGGGSSVDPCRSLVISSFSSMGFLCFTKTTCPPPARRNSSGSNNYETENPAVADDIGGSWR